MSDLDAFLEALAAKDVKAIATLNKRNVRCIYILQLERQEG